MPRGLTVTVLNPGFSHESFEGSGELVVRRKTAGDVVWDIT